MLISGKWGFVVKEAMRSEGGMREVTPGKLMSKKDGTEVGSSSSRAKCDEGRKSVQVKEPSCTLLGLGKFWKLETNQAWDRNEHKFMSRPDM